MFWTRKKGKISEWRKLARDPPPQITCVWTGSPGLVIIIGNSPPPWTKWSPFRRRYFQMQFLKWKCMNCDWHFNEICSQGHYWQWISIGSDTGLAPNRRQVIIWTNAGPIHWRIYAAIGIDELTFPERFYWEIGINVHGILLHITPASLKNMKFQNAYVIVT